MALIRCGGASNFGKIQYGSLKSETFARSGTMTIPDGIVPLALSYSYSVADIGSGHTTRFNISQNGKTLASGFTPYASGYSLNGVCSIQKAQNGNKEDMKKSISYSGSQDSSAGVSCTITITAWIEEKYY